MSLRTRLAAGLLLVAALLTSFQPAHAQFVDNKGTDFITSLNPNPIDGPPIVELHLTADTPTNVTVHYPVNAPTFNTTVAVNPGAITVVQLPPAASTGWAANAVGNNAVRMFAPEEFVAYTINRLTFTSDAALALPVEALNTDYIVTTYTATFRGQFTVVAAFDNTTVTITPSRNLAGGRPAGTPFNVTLQRGEGYLGEAAASGVAGDLTGTLIAADKPVAMTNGNYCVNVPSGTSACDHVFQVAQPVASWGNGAIAAPLANRPNGSAYRVVAAEDNTTVQRNGAVVATLDRGEFHDTGVVAGAQVFSADKPIFVTQFMTGVNFPGAILGDPAMGNVIPSEQFLSSYTFSTVAGAFSQHFLSVIAENADVSAGTILLDGTAIPAGDFTPIAGTTLSFATLRLSEGTHTTSSGGTHGITVSGFNPANSYLYPGGARFQFINPGRDTTPPVCSIEPDGDGFRGTATDRLADDPENRGIFFVALADGATNLTLEVDPFTPGAEEVAFRVRATDPTQDGEGAVVATDGAGNTCRQAIRITAGTPPPPVDTTPPICGPIRTEQRNGYLTAIVSSASDPESGIARVHFRTLRNLRGFAGPDAGSLLGPYAQGEETTFDPNETPSVALRAERIGAGGGAFVARIYNGAGLWRDCDPVVSELSATAPEAFSLEAPYPNPARASEPVRMAFGVAEASHVRLAVYDLVGREVARLVDGQIEAGRYEVAWDGRDAASGSLAAGVYVVRMEAGAFTHALRVTVMP